MGHTKFGSVGLPIPGVKIKITNNNEILIKGDNVFMGYYKDEEATKKILIDGYLQTGDLGHFDEHNYLYITGRKKDIIITGTSFSLPNELINFSWW